VGDYGWCVGYNRLFFCADYLIYDDRLGAGLFFMAQYAIFAPTELC